MPETGQQNTISDKAPKPSGLVPKNLQAFVLVGLALVMVLIMGITGHKSTAMPAAQTPSAIPSPIPLNTDKVSEFEKRIEDAQRSTAPQAEAALLRQQKQLAAEGTASAQPLPSSPYGTPITSSSATGAYPPGAYASALPQPSEGQPGDPFKAENKKRQYMSLFSDNVALTYRKDAIAAAASPATPTSGAESVPQDPLASQALTELARQSQLLAQVQHTAAPAQSAQVGSTLGPASIVHSTPATAQPAGTNENSATRSTLPIELVTGRNRNYVLFEGTVLESVLMNRLDGSFSGPVECLISNDIYSHDRQHVLIPAGSKVLGDAAKVTIPARGLFTGIAIFGAIGTGKTSGCMYPYAEQLIAYAAHDPERRMGGLVLEVKGDFCHKIRQILKQYRREEDYVEVNLNAEYRYNPLYNDLDAYALAYNIASLLTNLFGRGKEPFWQQAYTNLVKFIIQLHKVAYDYVTLFDIYECAINPQLLESKILEAEQRFKGRNYLVLADADFRAHLELEKFGFSVHEEGKTHKAPQSPALETVLNQAHVKYTHHFDPPMAPVDPLKAEILEGVKRWFYHDWQRIENKLRTSIVEGISVFLSLFDDDPIVKRTFCPPKECYDPRLNIDGKYGRPLPPFSQLIEDGKVCALNFPVSLNPGLAKAIGVMMKLDFQRAMLNRIPKIERNSQRQFRQAFFICDEYQHFATVGESDPNGDEKFFALSRQAKCIPIVATQSISSLRSSLPGETWRTLLQTFRTKIFLALSDEFSAKIASELCGKEDQWRVNYNISESGHDARVSLWTGKAMAHRANVTTSKSYNTQSDFRFDFKTFTELKNAQSVTLAYDGLNPYPPTFMYLKPYYNDVNKSYFRQLTDGEL